MQAWTMVTGANGFLGSELVRQLVAGGEHVKAFVRPGARLEPFRGLPDDRLLLAYGDILVEHTVYRALAGCTRLYHVASNFELWDPKPERVLGPAVEGTRATLSAAKARGIEKIVVTSSAGVLGVSSVKEPMDESHEFNLSDPEVYVRAKRQADAVVEDMISAGLPVVRVLPSVIVGAGDWKPTPNGRLLLEYLQSSPNGRFPVGSGGSNLVDVEDVALGHMLAMSKGKIGERYILGGEDLAFTEIFEILSDLTGLAEPTAPKSQGLLQLAGRFFELKARLFGGVPKLTARYARDYAGSFTWVSSAKAERELGYTHRPARAALARAVRWFLANGYVAQEAATRVRLELGPA